jgi:hypothetical protein
MNPNPVLMSVSDYEPDLMILLGVLESYRRQIGIETLTVCGSKTMASLTREFAFNVRVERCRGLRGHQATVDLDQLLAEVRNSDSLAQQLLFRLNRDTIQTVSESTLDLNRVYSFLEHTHLGDAISILSGLESYCTANKLGPAKVYGTGAFPAVFDLLSFSSIESVGRPRSRARALETQFKHSSWRMPWLLRYSRALSEEYGGICPFEVKPPVLRDSLDVTMENVICCQFDSRSHDPPYAAFPERVLRILALGADIRVVGGVDTLRYLDDTRYTYELGDLPFLAARLRSCKMFIGCDSGLAHLAGVLGVPSVVTNYSDFESVFHFFRSYPKSVVISRELFSVLNVE